MQGQSWQLEGQKGEPQGDEGREVVPWLERQEGQTTVPWMPCCGSVITHLDHEKVSPSHCTDFNRDVQGRSRHGAKFPLDPLASLALVAARELCVEVLQRREQWLGVKDSLAHLNFLFCPSLRPLLWSSRVDGCSQGAEQDVNLKQRCSSNGIWHLLPQIDISSVLSGKVSFCQ